MYLVIHNILSLVLMDSYQSFIFTVKENNEEISATSKQQPEAQVSKEWPKYTCPCCEKGYHHLKHLRNHMGAVHHGKKLHHSHGNYAQR